MRIRKVLVSGVFIALLSLGVTGVSSRTPAAVAPVDKGPSPAQQTWQSWYQSVQADPSGPELSQEQMDYVRSDAESVVSDEFHIAPEMAASFNFWLRIYSQYTSQQVVLFDNEHLNLVYEVIDLRPIASRARNRMAYEIMAHHKIVSRTRAYRAALRKLAKNPHPKHPDEFQKRILEVVKGLDHKHPYAWLARHVWSQTGQRDAIIDGLENAEPYLGKMEKVFTSVGVPAELTRLSLVESSFNTRAISRVGAVGVWQFMERSAREYLTVNRRIGVDERLSPLKSSLAAARLLRRNQKILGNWAFAVTSYNHGFGGLKKRAKKALDSNQIAWELTSCKAKPSLGWAGRNYYAEFLAVVYAEAYRKYFYPDLQPLPLRNLAFSRIKRSETANEILRKFKLSAEEFRLYNPDIRNMSRKLPRGYLIAIPREDEDLAALFSRKPPRVI